MLARLRNEKGFGLVELLIAMTVMSIAIFALVAGFSSSAKTLNRASKTATAGVVADVEMEKFHLLAHADAAFAPGPATDTTPLGPDGRTYGMRTEIALGCIAGTLDTSVTPPVCTLGCVAGTLDTSVTPPVCPDGSPAVKSRPVKFVTVTVRDGVGGPVLVKETSTFDKSTGE